MGLVVSHDLPLPQRHHQFRSIVGELEDLARPVVHDPDVALGVVWVHGDLVWPHEEVIPLRPGLYELTITVQDKHEMVGRVVSVGAWSRGSRRGRVLQVSSLKDEDSVRCVWVHCSDQAEGPPVLVPRQRLEPIFHYFVGSCNILIPLDLCVQWCTDRHPGCDGYSQDPTIGDHIGLPG